MIGSVTNATSDTTTKALTGQEVTATGATQAGVAGGVGGAVSNSPILQTIATEIGNGISQKLQSGQ